jgi:hypothetical protein
MPKNLCLMKTRAILSVSSSTPTANIDGVLKTDPTKGGGEVIYTVLIK